MHKRCLCLRVVSVPSCVRPSVCMSRSCILSKRINISSIFFTSGCHTILVFPYQTSGQYPTETPITGASNAGGVWKNRCFRPVSRFIACCQRCDRQASPRQVSSTRCRRTVASWWHSSLVAVSGGVCWWRETDDEVLDDKKPQRYTEDSGKSETAVTRKKSALDVCYAY